VQNLMTLNVELNLMADFN